MLDLVRTDFRDVEGARVGSRVETSDHCANSIDVVMEQPIPHLVCRQEASLKNSVG